MKTSGESGEEKGAAPKSKTQPQAKKPRQSWWQRSKSRRLFRRGAYLTEQGSKETVKIAGIAAAWTFVASLIAGALYLDLTDRSGEHPLILTSGNDSYNTVQQ